MMKTPILIMALAAILIGCAMNTSAKTPFNGILMTADGDPVNRAHIYVKNPRDYAVSNKKGEFGLTDVLPGDTLKILIKKRLYQIPVDGKKSMKIWLADEHSFKTEEDKYLMDIGYGFVPRRERTTPGNFISGEELRRTGGHNLMTALQGRIPGLNITGDGENFDINIRGTRSFYGSSTPLFFIDSVKVPSLEGISLNDVEYVEVMKDASIYGSEGANGAIMVHTYKGR